MCAHQQQKKLLTLGQAAHIFSYYWIWRAVYGCLEIGRNIDPVDSSKKRVTLYIIVFVKGFSIYGTIAA